ncbi:serine/threonine-protein kinase [Hyalangium sp.]|uniref:serine/threonine protein kinase n=1 Tax=Hyalangium sp. TaxID=2028555 RepID=UPI002D2BE925|nr:serine/threonine-protein kinase [Hyalangium sp.]HYH95789.1 serine/threonine-protein kinase [Hyalangium sp.]
MVTSPRSPSPTPFGDYLLLDRVGLGGMAEVWRAKRFGGEGLGRVVALKRILPMLSVDEEFVSMFLDEGQLGLQLLHPNIAQIFELGQVDSEPFLSMEYIPGKSLGDLFEHQRKAGKPAPIPLVCYCIAEMCAGLDSAHRKKDGMGRDLNIVHRGLSLQDVLLSFEGEVKVIDFGIAKAAGRVTQTQPGIIKGKFGYISPEQIDSLPVDRRSDVFATGVCLYELLTGQRLFVSDSPYELVRMTREVQVAPPSTHNRLIPKILERIILRALAPDVNERYPYASELGDDLRSFLTLVGAGFTQQDLRQYMRATFAQDVQLEEQRQREYSQIVPPKGFDVP